MSSWWRLGWGTRLEKGWRELAWLLSGGGGGCLGGGCEGGWRGSVRVNGWGGEVV